MKKTALYVRVSTEEQARHGLSLQTQLDHLRQYAEDNGYTVINEYTDDGVSAHKAWRKRPALCALLDDVKSGLIDYILFIKLDRWFRNVGDYYEVQKILDAHGASWKATLEDYETETSSGRFKVNIMLSVAEAESSRTSERIKFVFEAKKSRGEYIGGIPPYGLKLENKHAIPDPETAPIILDFYRKFVELRNINALSQYALENYGQRRTTHCMKNFLSYEIYKDTGVVPADLWDKVQEILKIRCFRRTPSGRVYLYGSLLICKECGKKMRAFTSQYTDGIFYNCSDRAQFGPVHGCRHKAVIKEDDIEQYLIDHIIRQAEVYNIEMKAKSKAPKIDTAALRRKQDKLVDLYINDMISKEKYESEYNAIAAKLLTVKPPQQIAIEPLQSALQIYDKLDRQHRKAFWSQLISSITIDADNNLFIAFHL